MRPRKPQTQTDLSAALAADVRAVVRRLKLRLREQSGGHDLAPSQISVLHRLEKTDALTVSTLARAEGMRPQSMSAVVAPLQEAGLVAGVPDPNDGRQTLMSLTPKCIKWLQQGRSAQQDWLTRSISAKLSLDEQEELQAALRLLVRLVQE